MEHTTGHGSVGGSISDQRQKLAQAVGLPVVGSPSLGGGMINPLGATAQHPCMSPSLPAISSLAAMSSLGVMPPHFPGVNLNMNAINPMAAMMMAMGYSQGDQQQVLGLARGDPTNAMLHFQKQLQQQVEEKISVMTKNNALFRPS